MSSLDELELKTLADARGFIEPDTADVERVLSRLSAHLALSGAPRVSCVDSAANRSAARWGHLAGSAKALVVSCTLLGVAAGFGAGYFVGRHGSPVEHASHHIAVPVAVSEARQVAHGEPTAAPGSSQATPSAQPSESAHGYAHPSVITPQSRGTVASVSASASGPTPDDPIAEEVALLKRVDQAIRSHDSQLALGLIRELDQRCPKGKLLEERAAARVMAQCQQLEPAAARKVGEIYLRKAPSHVYHERVRQLCGLGDSPTNAKPTSTEKASGSPGD